MYDSSTGWTTLTEHWDGSQWSIIPSPNPLPSPGSTDTRLQSVSATSANDVWAVGFYLGENSYQPLIEHWNGDWWSIVPNSHIGTEYNILRGVTAISANDAWAVGVYDFYRFPLTLHWDGVQWSIVPNPIPAGANTAGLNGVTAISSNDVWAVGSADRGAPDIPTLTEHWDGSQWTIIPSPSVTRDSTHL